MKTIKMFALAALASAGFLAGARLEVRVHAQQPAEQGDNQSFRFKTGVELINVTATVTDQNGRFVPGLQQDDFRVYQDERAAAGHALQRRARAGQPRHRARHQRQHGGREDGGGARRARPLPLRSCSSRTTKSSCTGSATTRC